MTTDHSNNDDCDYSGIIHKYKDLAYNIALRITHNEQDSEEIVQDSFVKAFRGLSHFKKESQFSTWFYKIVYHTAISSVRHKKMDMVEANDQLANTPDTHQMERVISRLDAQDRKHIISKAMEKLNELDYTLLTLYYYEDLSLKEISGIVEKDQNYLKVLLQRARIKLYQSMSTAVRNELRDLK